MLGRMESAEVELVATGVKRDVRTSRIANPEERAQLLDKPIFRLV
jgi:hypothetical protein